MSLPRTCIALLAFIASCGGYEPAGTVTPIVSSVLPTAADVAIVELGDTTFAFDRHAVQVVREGKLATRFDAPADGWRAASTMPAPDREGRWVVGLAGGVLWKIDPTSGLKEASSRLGAGESVVLSLDSVGSTFVIGLHDGFVASNDSSHVMRFSGTDARVVAAAKERVAIGSSSGVDVVDLRSGSMLHYPIASPSRIVFRDAGTDHPVLVVVAGGDVYSAERGALKKVNAPQTQDVASSGSRLWLLGGSTLYVDDTQGRIAEARGPKSATAIFGSRTGGVWVNSRGGQATRVTLDVPTNDVSWHSLVEPVFERNCSKCHLAGGDADLDLSTPSAWAFWRRDIIDRVLVSRTMPPPGTDLSETDRHALESWLESP